MLTRSVFLRCAAPATFSRWLSLLADQAARVTASPHLTSSAASTPPTEITQLWAEIERASTQAFALRETDTLIAIVENLMQRGVYPADTRQWPVLLERLFTFSDIECRSVLQYPGLPDHVLRYQHTGTGMIGGPADHMGGPVSTVPSLASVSREMLLLTGGIVPLSARSCAADGAALSAFLSRFVDAWRHSEHGESLQKDRVILYRMCAATLHVLERNAATMDADALHRALPAFLTLLLCSDMAHALTTGAESVPSPGTASDPHASLSFTASQSDAEVDVSLPLCRSFLWQMHHRLHAAPSLAPRLALLWVASVFNDEALAQMTPGIDNTVLGGHPEHALRAHFYRYVLSLLEDASVQLYAQLSDVARVPPTWRLSTVLAGLQEELQVLYQRNLNRDNALALTDATQTRLLSTLTLAQLRAMRLEARAPDAFLRDAVPIVERLPASMLVEAELLYAKIGLLDLLDLEKEGRDAVYDDLIRSLRHVVELRPRTSLRGGENSDESAADEPFGNSSSLASGAGEYDFERRASSAPSPSSLTPSGGLEAASQSVLQRAHVAVLTALCGAHQQARVDQAYELVVSHKYHGLIVDSAVILPLLKVMSRRGDCRVFNLVDLCVLYCQCPVDMEAITYLFQACAVAGDHYRARTLYQLLQEVVPGFALKATPSINESLRELKVVPLPPVHAFMTAEQKLARMATLAVDASALAPSPLASVASQCD